MFQYVTAAVSLWRIRNATWVFHPAGEYPLLPLEGANRKPHLTSMMTAYVLAVSIIPARQDTIVAATRIADIPGRKFQQYSCMASLISVKVKQAP